MNVFRIISGAILALLVAFAPFGVFAQSVSVSLIPTDEQINDQWYLSRIGALSAWDTVHESPNVVIAIVDTGIDTDHPDLISNIWENTGEIPDNGVDDDKNGYIDDVHGWDFVNDVPDPNPKFTEDEFNEIGINHGTIVAGVIAARGDNEFGVAGVTWRAQLMGLKALNDLGEGSVTDVIRSIDYAVANGADIINLSFVGTLPSDSLREAVARANRAGVMVVAASGNEDVGTSHDLNERPAYPVCYDNGANMIVGVAATDDLDQKAAFSNYGSSCVDIAAPGIGFLGLTVYEPEKTAGIVPFNTYVKGYWAGTSMAAPVVTGSLALLKAVNPKLTPAQAYDALFTTADDISRLNTQYRGQLGYGRLNIAHAVQRVYRELHRTKGVVVTVPQQQQPAAVRIHTASSTEFMAYESNVTGGARVAGGDVKGIGEDMLVVGSGPGGGPHVRIFDNNGNVQGQFFAYNERFRGGVNVAAGDVDGDGIDEIITGAGIGGGPHVRIFDNNGNVQGQFFAYNERFRGGVNVAAGDVDGDGIDEIITGAGIGGGPHVRIFDNNGNVQGQFFAYNERFRGGVNVAAGDVDGDGIDEIITGAGIGGGPHVRVFRANSTLVGQFFAYNERFRGGVNVAAGDVDQDSRAEIVTGAGPGGSPHVRVFQNGGKLINSFFAYDQNSTDGVAVGVVRLLAQQH